MTVNSQDTPINKIRYRKRAVDDPNWIQNMLLHAPYGVLGTSADNQPFLQPNLFAYDKEQKAIFFHTANKGRTISNINENPKVALTVVKMGRFLPASNSRDFSVEYASVVVFGTALILVEESVRTYGLQLLLDKYFPHLKPGKDYPELTLSEMRGAAVCRIDISSWSGKHNQAPPDFPDAFYYPKASWDELK